MKILDNEEKEAHIAHITAEGAKGLLYGSILSAGLFAYFKTKHPIKFRQMNTSVKTAMIAMPTIAISAFYADQGSVEFDREMHSSDYNQKKMMEQYKEWQSMPMSDKIIHSLNKNKYSIIIGTWAASLYGSWVLVNRDKIMTTAQKAVQARMYAQAISVVLLLGTILLAMKEEEIAKTKPAPIPEWQRILDERKQDEEERQKSLLKLNKQEKKPKKEIPST